MSPELETIILSGSGESLARKIIAEHPQTNGARVICLSEILSPALAEAACACAVAVRAAEQLS